MLEEIKDFPGEIIDIAIVSPAADANVRKAEGLAYMLSWLGQQCALVKDGKKDVAQANAKQMIPMFSGPMEEEILKFFIFDGGGGGGGSGNGGGGGQSGQDKGQGQSGQDKGDGSHDSGNGVSTNGETKPPLPDGEYEISTVLSFIAINLPKDSPHRMKWTDRTVLMDDAETFAYLSSSYGLPFKCKVYGGTYSFDSK